MVVHDVAHDLFLALLQLVLRLDVLDDEFLDGDGSVFVDIDLIEDLVNDFVPHLVIQNLLSHKTNKRSDLDSYCMLCGKALGTSDVEFIMGYETYFDLDEVVVELGSRDYSILIGINLGELIDKLLLHVVLKAGLLDALVNGVRVRQSVAHVHIHGVGRVR